MSVLRSMTWSTMDEDARRTLCARGLEAIFDTDLKASIGRIIDDVHANGDEAVCRALRDFDRVVVEPDQLKVTDDELADAEVSADVDAAIDDAIAHLRAFNTQLMQRAVDWSFESEPGLSVGEKITPISSAGLFVPSGKASYPSVAYQLGVPATVARVPELALVVPPMPGGGARIDPAVLVVCSKLGIDNVFRVNGPAGVAALGFGTESIPQVRKIVGPGSPPVTCAQVEMQRYGVATMMILGPTESLVIADRSADPRYLAADLLNEAEHGTDSAVVLVTTSTELLADVDLELQRQLAMLPPVRADAARAALGVNGGCVIVADLGEAADVANRWAPEHLQVAVDAAAEAQLVDRLVNVGEILVGQNTLFSAANFVIGCPASLPTGGFAHVSSGITADAFLKRTAVARADEHALARMTPTIVAMSEHEGFVAHANAALIRR
ncbi:MAG TPA: histidinol dehydrogenase, partial [Ilumatobacteraceae bacterium]|nr:histidinol dehydrogenase [Ilumatobacteraceae bacterium]